MSCVSTSSSPASPSSYRLRRLPTTSSSSSHSIKTLISYDLQPIHKKHYLLSCFNILLAYNDNDIYLHHGAETNVDIDIDIDLYLGFETDLDNIYLD